MTALFMPKKGHGLANILIMLCDFFYEYPDGVVHESIKDFEMGRWLTFNFPITHKTDITPCVSGNIYFNENTMKNVHPIVRSLVQPSPELEKILKSKMHILDNVKVGIHLRRGAAASDSRAGVEFDRDSYADKNAVNTMIKISEEHGVSNVFLASDSPETKKLFDPRIRTLDTGVAVVHDFVLKDQEQDRMGIFLDFFLLSRCPQLVITGGKFPEQPGLSTFGYMAALYGGKNYTFIKN